MRRKRGDPTGASQERSAIFSASRIRRACDHPINAACDKSGHGERGSGRSSAQWAAFAPERRGEESRQGSRRADVEHQRPCSKNLSEQHTRNTSREKNRRPALHGVDCFFYGGGRHAEIGPARPCGFKSFELLPDFQRVESKREKSSRLRRRGQRQAQCARLGKGSSLLRFRLQALAAAFPRRALAFSFSLADFSCPQAAMMSRPRGVLIGLA